MKQQVLIVDDDPELLLSINCGLEHNDRFRLLKAKNGREALAVLETNRVDLVVTELNMPVMDGVELISVMSDSFSEVSYVVMTAFRTSVMEEYLKKAGALNILEKPLDIDELEQAINKALDIQEEQNCSLAGLPLSSFLQLVAMEQKTAHLKIFHLGGQCGSLFFHDGDLIDAEYNDLSGDEAVLKMLAWENVRVSIKEFAGPFSASRMKSELLSLIFTALQRQDWNEEEPENPLQIVKKEFDRMKQTTPEKFMCGRKNRQKPSGQADKKKEGMKDLLKKMAGELDGVLAVQVTGLDGITVALHNPADTDIKSFSENFILVMKLIDKSVGSLQEMGEFEESLVQTRNAWILTRFITPQHYVGIAVNREGTPGNLRLVVRSYLDRLRRSL
ncbi:MAG: response regulator [Candidatus Electrothrix sp. GM3_4]|nr:response regulator [Candidatus Electrothrix sp. GM3_4]